MKHQNLKSVLLTGLGMTIGFIVYDLLFQESVDWGRAIFVGVFVILITLLIHKFTNKKKRGTKA